MASFLYPPIIPSYIPAVVHVDGKATISIPVSFSPFHGNSNEVKAIQYCVQHQNTNANILSGNGIKEYAPNLAQDSNMKAHLADNNVPIFCSGLNINTFYKVQMRFSKVAYSPTQNKSYQEWLNENRSSFSEWSTVCLFKVISRPSLIIEDSWSKNENNPKNTNHGKFQGLLSFADSNDKEYLKSYQMKLYEKETLLDETGLVLADVNNPNHLSFDYYVNLLDDTSKKYFLKVNYTTINGYSPAEELVFPFYIEEDAGTQPILYWDTQSAETEGAIRLFFKMPVDNETIKDSVVMGNYIISRSSIEDNYTRWEDVHLFFIGIQEYEKGLKNQIMYEWADYLAFPNVLYKYAIQYVVQDKDGNMQRSKRKIQDPTDVALVNLKDIFLFDGQHNLSLKFNPNISSYKKTLLESKTETLGSQFPFIRRNGAVGYRQFSIGGLISYHMDDLNYDDHGYQKPQGENVDFDESSWKKPGVNSNFLKDLFVRADESSQSIIEVLSAKEEFNKEFYLERKFRERVMDFLYKDNVKLFRSEAEGAILVRLMDISFTPETVLGRMIYSFTATAYEIAEATFDNLQKFNIVDLGGYTPIDKAANYEVRVGQIKLNNKTNEYNNILSLIENQCKKTTYALDYSVSDIYFLRFQFLNPQRVINNMMYGHSIKVGEAEFLVPNYIYQITDVDLDLRKNDTWTQIGLMSSEDEVIIDYVYQQKTVVSDESQRFSNRTEMRFGQIFSVLQPSESINILSTAYNRHTKIKQSEGENRIVKEVKALSIEAPAGAIFQIQDKVDVERNASSGGEEHIMNASNKMFFYEDGESCIRSLKYRGVRLAKAPNTKVFALSRVLLRAASENEYLENNLLYLKIEDIVNPVPNTMYNIGTTDNNSKYIYYHNNWYKAIKEADTIYRINAPIDAVIDYCLDVGVYEKQ